MLKNKNLSWKRVLSNQLIGFQIEHHQFRRANRCEVLDRRHHATVYHPQSIAPVEPRSIHGDQFRAIQISSSGAVPFPGRIRLQLRAAFQRKISWDVVQGRRYTCPQPWNTHDDPVPRDLYTRWHYVFRTILIEKLSIVGQSEVQKRPLRYGF